MKAVLMFLTLFLTVFEFSNGPELLPLLDDHHDTARHCHSEGSENYVLATLDVETEDSHEHDNCDGECEGHCHHGCHIGHIHAAVFHKIKDISSPITKLSEEDFLYQSKRPNGFSSQIIRPPIAA